MWTFCFMQFPVPISIRLWNLKCSLNDPLFMLFSFSTIIFLNSLTVYFSLSSWGIVYLSFSSFSLGDYGGLWGNGKKVFSNAAIIISLPIKCLRALSRVYCILVAWKDRDFFVTLPFQFIYLLIVQIKFVQRLLVYILNPHQSDSHT